MMGLTSCFRLGCRNGDVALPMCSDTVPCYCCSFSPNSNSDGAWGGLRNTDTQNMLIPHTSPSHLVSATHTEMRMDHKGFAGSLTLEMDGCRAAVRCQKNENGGQRGCLRTGKKGSRPASGRKRHLNLKISFCCIAR